MRAYRRLAAPKAAFWEAYEAFRKAHALADMNIEPEVFEGLRDPGTGRELNW
jgi:hypothetical protein